MNVLCFAEIGESESESEADSVSEIKLTMATFAANESEFFLQSMVRALHTFRHGTRD